jgi:hypothetical protein
MLRNQRIAILFGLLAISILCSRTATSQSSAPVGSTPPIQTEKQSDRVPNGTQGTADTQAAPQNAPVGQQKNAPDARDKSGSEVAKNQQDAPEHVSLWGYSMKFGELLLSIVTLLLFLATVGLVLATWLLVRDAKKSSERQLRAYISVRPRTAIDVYAERTPTVTFQVINTGQTPAYNVRYLAIGEILPYPLARNQGDLVSPMEEEISTRPVHAKMHIKGEAIAEQPISMEMYRAMIGTTHRFYLAGIVFYEDVFGITRKTKFCAYFGGPEYDHIATLAHHERQRPVYMDWIFADVHNEAT